MTFANDCQACLPVLGAGDAGGAGHPLPAGDGDALAAGRLDGNVGQQLEQLGATDPATVELEQVEQEAGDQPLGDEGAGPAVPRDAGRVEVVLDQAGVGPVGRPHDRHAGERCAARAASTSSRTTWRTSSSASVVETIETLP
jgi:hypothetical protein